MAEVIREGGSDPLKPGTHRDYVKLALLEMAYDNNCTRRSEIPGRIGIYIDTSWLASKFARKLGQDDTDAALNEMFKDGWIEISEWHCSCCANADLKPEELAKHVKSFKLTEAGYAKVPEHIFP